MGTAERRSGIMKILCRRRCEKIHNLALEFGVSDRTIQRDIEALSLTEPIYTQAGRYGGGVYVADEYYIDRMYMSSEEIILLNKILHIMTEHMMLDLWMPFWWFNRNTGGMTTTQLEEGRVMGSFEMFRKMILSNVACYLPEIESIRFTKPEEYALFKKQDVKSFLAVPYV